MLGEGFLLVFYFGCFGLFRLSVILGLRVSKVEVLDVGVVAAVVWFECFAYMEKSGCLEVVSIVKIGVDLQLLTVLPVVQLGLFVVAFFFFVWLSGIP